MVFDVQEISEKTYFPETINPKVIKPTLG